MTNAQKLALRASEIRTRLAELAGIEEITDEQRAEIGALRTEYGDVETRSQAAIVAGDEPKPVTETATEARELAELIEGSSIGAIFGATLEHRADRWPDARAARGAGPERRIKSRLCTTPRPRAPRDWRHAGAGRTSPRRKPRSSRLFFRTRSRLSLAWICRPLAWARPCFRSCRLPLTLACRPRMPSKTKPLARLAPTF